MPLAAQANVTQQFVHHKSAFLGYKSATDTGKAFADDL